jgi:hypothetical protein
LGARLLLALAALLAAVWLALSLLQARAQERAFNVGFSGSKTTRAQNATGVADARAARRLSPDAAPKLLEWQILLRDGRRSQGEAVLRQVVALEPQNYEAWLYLSRTSADPAVARRAKARVAALGPAR